MVYYSVLSFVMECGAKGYGVIVREKLCVQHTKSIKFKEGYLISSGQSVENYNDSIERHVLLK